MRNYFVVTRNWDNPKIHIGISEDAITIDMELAAFLSALSIEYGSPASTLTPAQHLTRLTAAAETVVSKMKHETSAVIG